MTTKIKIRRGPISDLKNIQLDDGEMGVTSDTRELYFGMSGGLNPIDKMRKQLVPVDYNNKAQGLGFFKRTSGTGTLSYDPTESSMGSGCFSITGNGTWSIDSLYAISPLFGIGGNVVIKGTAAFNIGCQFFDINKTLIGSVTTAQQNFLANNIVGGPAFSLRENYLKSEGVGVNNLPMGARHAKPFITISGNSGTIKFDHFDIYQLSSIAFYF